MTPTVFILRMTLFALSEKYTLPESSTASPERPPVVKFSVALMACPPSPA